MKRFFAIIILILYSIANFGVGVHTHWCGGKISSINISFSSKHTCGCGPKMDKSCCKNEFVYSKLSGEHLKCASSIFNSNKIDFQPKVYILDKEFIHQTFLVIDFSQYHAPPFKTKHSIFLANDVFRI